MAERVSDERLAELLGPELSVIKYAEVYLLAEEVRAARAREAADALLATFPILAGVTDEAVEAGALALIRHVEGGRPARPVSAHARELARVVLEAVIGKEQNE